MRVSLNSNGQNKCWKTLNPEKKDWSYQHKFDLLIERDGLVFAKTPSVCSMVADKFHRRRNGNTLLRARPHIKGKQVNWGQEKYSEKFKKPPKPPLGGF